MVAGGEADARALFSRLIPAAAGLAERYGPSRVQCLSPGSHTAFLLP